MFQTWDGSNARSEIDAPIPFRPLIARPARVILVKRFHAGSSFRFLQAGLAYAGQVEPSHAGIFLAQATPNTVAAFQTFFREDPEFTRVFPELRQLSQLPAGRLRMSLGLLASAVEYVSIKGEPAQLRLDGLRLDRPANVAEFERQDQATARKTMVEAIAQIRRMLSDDARSLSDAAGKKDAKLGELGKASDVASFLIFYRDYLSDEDMQGIQKDLAIVNERMAQIRSRQSDRVEAAGLAMASSIQAASGDDGSGAQSVIPAMTNGSGLALGALSPSQKKKKADALSGFAARGPTATAALGPAVRSSCAVRSRRHGCNAAP